MGHSGKTFIRRLVAAVVGVIAFFGVLLVLSPTPGYSHSKERAMFTHCLSNTKQLLTGLLMYAENGGELPPKENWLESAKRHTEKDSFFVCPRIPRELPDRFGYAFNSKLDRVKIKAIASPETTPIVFETSRMGRNLSDAMISLPNPPRHREGNNVGYADGHAKAVGAPNRRG